MTAPVPTGDAIRSAAEIVARLDSDGHRAAVRAIRTSTSSAEHVVLTLAAALLATWRAVGLDPQQATADTFQAAEQIATGAPCP